MPQTLERMPRMLRRVVCGYGHELPRVVAYNENHDELGRFAEGQGRGAGKGSPITFVPHPNQRDHETTILVDPKKIDQSWKKVEDEYLPPTGTGKSEVPGRRAGVREFLQKGKPVEASRMILHNGEVSFIDGRHRMAVMRDRGEPRMAVTVPKDQADEFQRRFGIGTKPHPVTATGRELPRVVAYNPNHDGAGRFAESQGEGGGGGGGRQRTGQKRYIPSHGIHVDAYDPHLDADKSVSTQKVSGKMAADPKIAMRAALSGKVIWRGIDPKEYEARVSALTKVPRADLEKTRQKLESAFRNNPSASGQQEANAALTAVETAIHLTDSGFVASFGRELPRVVAYNENHDEQGRFAESAGEGGAGDNPKLAKFKELTANPPAPKIDREAIRELVQVQKLSPEQIRKDILDGTIDRGSVSRNEKYVDKIYRLAERASDRDGNINGKPYEDVASDAVDRFLGTVADAAFAEATAIGRDR